MTLFRLLHGKAWHDEAPNPQGIVPGGGFVDTLKWLPHIPKRWRRFIRKMLNDDPAARYQNAGQALGALSNLPVTPAWVATVAPKLGHWEQKSKTRLNVVEWKRHAPRKHDWSAWSEPLGKGRRKTLGGSDGIIGSRQCVAELENYFDIQ